MLLLAFLPYYALTLAARGPEDDCRNIQNSVLHEQCVKKALDSESRAHLHWNAWGSLFSWPGVVLLLVVAVVVGFKAIFSKSEKVVLNRQTKLALLIGDALFLVAMVHIPHDNAGRAWALWLSMVCVLALNVGVLLATTETGEWIAEHWPARSPRPATAPPAQQSPAAPYPPSQGTAADYRPTPQATPPGQRSTAWPQQPGSFGQGGFPSQGDQPRI